MTILCSIRDDVLRRDFGLAVSTVYLPALGPDLCQAAWNVGDLGEDLLDLKRGESYLMIFRLTLNWFHMDVSKNRGKNTKMDGENNGKPYQNGWFVWICLGVPLFLETPISDDPNQEHQVTAAMLNCG